MQIRQSQAHVLLVGVQDQGESVARHVTTIFHGC